MDWIIGGTKDSRDFIKLLSEKNINLKNIILTTVSDYGKKLAEESSVAVKSGAMNKDEMKIFVSQYNIERIFDFSHPYALEVSKNAMETARDTGKKYFRFERKNLENDCISFEKTDELIKYLETLKGNILITLGTNSIHEFKNLKNIENIYFRILPVKISTGKKYFRFERKNLENDCISFDKTDELIKYLETLKGNILITLGTNNIHEFKNLKNIENMYFRILPVKISIEKAENIGIKAKNIIGLQGPFSKEFNTAIYKNYEIKYVVTKESGDTGGELEKLQAAYETGVIPYLETLKGNILITLGTNNIHEFKNLKNIENMYFRILPVKISIEKAENIGIKAKNIIGLQGPFSKEFNTAIYKNYEIKYVVTKESGDTGGELEKLQAAYETGVIPIILKRPKIEYPWVTENMEEILKIITETEKQERK